MSFRIVSKTRNRARFRSDFKFGFEAAEKLADQVQIISGIETVEVNARTGSVLINFVLPSALADTARLLSEAEPTLKSMPKTIPSRENSVTEITFWPALRLAFGGFLPLPLRIGMLVSGTKDILVDGLKNLFRGKLTVEVLDMSSILLALLMRDLKTAATTALLLGLGEKHEEYTRRKTMENLTESLAVNVDTVCVLVDGTELEIIL